MVFGAIECIHKLAPVLASIIPVYEGIRKTGEEVDLVIFIRTPVIIQRRLGRTETNLMHFKWEVT